MERFYKVEDPEVIKAFLEKMALRDKFIADWNKEGKRRGFTGGHVVNWRFDHLFDMCADGFLATRTQLIKRDTKVYKAGRHYEGTNDYVVHVKVGNKKAYKEYRDVLPHEFEGESIEKLFYDKPNPTWPCLFRDVNWTVPNVILFESIKHNLDSFTLKPCLIEIKQSEYLALQGK